MKIYHNAVDAVYRLFQFYVKYDWSKNIFTKNYEIYKIIYHIKLGYQINDAKW